MKHPSQSGLFDGEERAAQLTEMDDPLVGLKARIDWEAFRLDLSRVHEKDRKSKAGAKPFCRVDIQSAGATTTAQSVG